MQSLDGGAGEPVRLGTVPVRYVRCVLGEAGDGAVAAVSTCLLDANLLCEAGAAACIRKQISLSSDGHVRDVVAVKNSVKGDRRPTEIITEQCQLSY